MPVATQPARVELGRKPPGRSSFLPLTGAKQAKSRLLGRREVPLQRVLGATDKQ